MPVETEDFHHDNAVAAQPLPPEIRFSQATGHFSGTATPGLTIMISSSDDTKTHSTTVDVEGNWSIDLGSAPEWYTILEIWACNVAEGSASDKVRITVGGSSPTMADIYASETLAFGATTPNAEVAVYGPDGRTLRKTFAFNRSGCWSVGFENPLREGERICIIATLPNGNTSLPHFTTVKKFSVEDRNVAHIAGFGAAPEDRIELSDAKTGFLIARTKASHSGAWTMDFSKALDDGLPVQIRRVHKNGTTASGPKFLVTLGEKCLAPAIELVATGRIGGEAQPGLQVNYGIIHDDRRTYSGSATADSSGLWNSDPDSPVPHFADGDVIEASTKNLDTGAVSYFYSAVEIGGERPNLPSVTKISRSGAYGLADAQMHIVASTRDLGAFFTARTDDDGNWSMGWTGHVGSLSKDTIVYFEAREELSSGDILLPTSLFASSLADTDAIQISKPVIDNYDGVVFTGTEETAGTTIRLYDHDDHDNALNLKLAPVVNQKWTVTPDYTPTVGHRIFAVADIQNAQGEATSPRSDYYTIETQPVVNRPIPPQIQGIETDEITGTAQYNTQVTLTVTPPKGTSKTYIASPTEDEYWSVQIDEAQPFNTVFTATAVYVGDTIASDQFIRVLGENQLHDVILKSVGANSVSGIAAQQRQVIMAWRTSDGTKMVDKQVADGTSEFDFTYLNGLTLEPGDQLNVVSTYETLGNMTKYNSKVEGYSIGKDEFHSGEATR
ncbi:hypothetical protein [Martelella sp. AMO21009]